MANAAVQASGESIHSVGKEHHLKSLRAIAGYFATCNVKYYEVAYGDPNKPLAESLRALAEAYAKEHSIFREKDYRLDPGYISLNQLADKLPETATYQQELFASEDGDTSWMVAK